MSIDISRVARAIRDLTHESLRPILLGRAQEYVAASLGFGSLAACKAAAKLRPEGFEDNSRFVVVDDDALWRRARLLEPDAAWSRARLVAFLTAAIDRVHAGTIVRSASDRPNLSISAAISEALGISGMHDFDDVRYTVVENNHGEVLGFRLHLDEPEWEHLFDEINGRHGNLDVFLPVSVRLLLRGCATPQERYYLHGDQVEGDPSQYFCASCDLFVELPHFEADHPNGNASRYFAEQRLWERAVARFKLPRRRPINAPNALAQSALAEREAYEAGRSDFHRWIVNQTERGGALGRLAVDIKRDPSFPVHASTRDELLEYLRNAARDDEPLRAFKRAWREFHPLASDE